MTDALLVNDIENLPAGLRARPVTEADYPALVELFNVCDRPYNEVKRIHNPKK